MSMTLKNEFLDQKSEFIEALQTARDAELNDEPLQNGKQRDVDVSKNTHFEFQLGGDEYPEVYVYVERYEPNSAIELMLWVDDAYFEDLEDLDWPRISHGGDQLEALAETVLDIANEHLTDKHPFFEFHMHAPPSVVFATMVAL